MKKFADVLIVLSVAAAAVSGYVNVSGADVLKLAGTQWILIAIALGIYGLYFKNREN